MSEEAIAATIAFEIKRFERFALQCQQQWPIENTGMPSHVAAIGTPSDKSLSRYQQKRFGLTVMAVTHGNELAGLRAVNDAVEFQLTTSSALDYTTVFVLGNVPACNKNQRFIESDLNRAFAAPSTRATLECARAKHLEPILAESQFFLDLHQTREPSKNPFFIFPHTKLGFDFARAVSAGTPIVTHWGDAFSKDGMCSDEFVNSTGGTGITIELGQNGFNDFSVGAGLRCIQRAQIAVNSYFNGGSRVFAQGGHQNQTAAEIYTWSETIDYPKSGDIILKPGLMNFSELKDGEVIGEFEGKDISVKHGGYVLFPYYRKPNDQKRPSELCRIMKKIALSDLP